MNKVFLTASAAAANRRTVGRKQINYEQTVVRLPLGSLARVAAILRPGEKKADFLRDAFENELRRRESACVTPERDK